MRIAISSLGKELEAMLDPRFGRTEGFLLYDTESGRSSYLDNADNASDPNMAGIKTAQNVVDAGAAAVITCHIGPNAYPVLESSGVQVYLCDEMPVREAIHKFEQGNLQLAQEPDASRHWQSG